MAQPGAAGHRADHAISAQRDPNFAICARKHRSRLYELLEYERHNEFDTDIFNFTLGGSQ